MSQQAGTVRAGITPCPGGSNGDVTLQTRQIQAKVGESYTLTFGGSPPYNLTKTVFRAGNTSQLGDTLFCGLQQVTLSNNTYTWLVNTFETTRQGETNQFVIPGDAVMFAAVETNSTTENRWFSSSNYTIISENATTTSAGIHTMDPHSGLLSPLLFCVFLSVMFRRFLSM